MKDKIEKLHKKLSRGLDKHYEELSRTAPRIQGYQLHPQKPISDDPILLPWRFSEEERTAFGVEALLYAERELRVAQAHDALARIRKSLGIRSYMSRHALKSNGYKENKNAQLALRRAEANVKLWRQVYNYSWKALEKLGVTGNDLRGLQQLTKDHLVVLGDWLEAERYRSKDKNDRLPWIWTIAMMENPDSTAEDQEAMVESWNREGEWEGGSI